MMKKLVYFAAIVAVLLYFINDSMNGCSYQSDVRLDGKVVMVTGANTGIGKETVVDFVLRGAKVYMGCRSEERGRNALNEILDQTGVDKDTVVLLKLDLASLASVREFAREFKTRESKLDILVNNAGVMWVPHSKTVDGFETTFGTNHLGHFLLTNLLVDNLLAAAQSRVVTVSSYGHMFGTIKFDDLMGTRNYNRIYAYSNSKLANVLFARELAKRLEGTGVTSYSLHPGSIITELGRHAPIINLPIIRTIAVTLLGPFLKDASHGARMQVYLSVEPGVEKYNGEYFSNCAVTEPLPEAKDDAVAKRLWEVSVDLVKLTSEETHPKLRVLSLVTSE